MRINSEVWFGVFHLAVVFLLWLAVMTAIAAPLAKLMAAPAGAA